MPRSQRQLLDEPADERSFLFYVPSKEASEPERPQRGEHRSTSWPSKFFNIPFDPAYHRSGADGERTMLQRECL